MATLEPSASRSSQSANTNQAAAISSNGEPRTSSKPDIPHHTRLDLSPRNNLRFDVPAGLVVFLVALPLCLGIALASGAPLFSGIIAGIVGGIVVSMFSGSELAVSGPAAGLTVIVAAAIQNIGSFDGFLMAVVIAGALQIALGYLRAGIVGEYIPSSVIRGMLAAIGIVIILKQIPHALGQDSDYEGDFSFLEPGGKENSISEIVKAVVTAQPEAIIITILSITLLLLWERPWLKKHRFFTLVPAPLVVVVLGVAVNAFFQTFFTNFYLRAEDGHLVSLPVAASVQGFFQQFSLPNFQSLANQKVWIAGVTLAIVASLETLLSLEAIDKLDPFKRISDTNKELKAQGIGNFISGMLGGLPMTAVIVRGSANVYAGARTRLSSMVHGFLLLLSVALIPMILNLIPLASLASVLLVIGYKLAKVDLFKSMYKSGKEQFLPFIATVLAIIFTDLLTGIAIGICVGFFFIVRANHHQASTLTHVNTHYVLRFNKDMTFINKAELKDKLRTVPDNSYLLIDGAQAHTIDNDIYDIINEFSAAARFRNIEISYNNFEAKKTQYGGAH